MDPFVALFDTNPLLYSVALSTDSCHNSNPSIQMAFVPFQLFNQYSTMGLYHS